MRYVFRTLALMLTTLLVWNLATAQRSLDELPPGTEDQLHKPGARESHQGADNPRQGGRSDRQGRWGGPDPYGPESYEAFMDKAEMKMNDPQWQLKIDMQHPKRIVVQYPDGTAEDFWYVMFRVINDNTRQVKETIQPELHDGGVDLGRRIEPLETQDISPPDFEGVPVDAHLDFEFHVFTRNIERDPWDTEIPEEDEDEVLSSEALAQRHANMKTVYRPVSDHFVLQRIAEAEGMYEWMDNRDYINEPVFLLHPLSDFQRQVGFAHELTANDFSGPRALGYRFVVIEEGSHSEATRFVAVYQDNTFAGFFGQGDTLPDGARLVDSPDDPMWGNLTIRRYQAGDSIDRYGRPLRANEPGYLNARVAGGRPEDTNSYGVIPADHPAVGQPVQIPHARLYKASDRVLVNYETSIPHRDFPNRTHVINGKVLTEADPRWASGREVGGDSDLRQHIGTPVKMLDQRGRPIRRYVVTYQPGDVLTQAEWDIYRRRLGPGILSRYSGIGDIVGRPLRPDDPVVGMPKIRMGHFTGDQELVNETISRGIDTGRRGPNDEVILQARDGYETGRSYDARRIDPQHFRRDMDGEFTTNRIAPLPGNHGLNAGEEYIYAPLGNAAEGARPVPRFDEHGAWEDYYDPISNQRIPLTDTEGELVRDMQDQILYLKAYEYEYMYMYEYERMPMEDDGFRGRHGGEEFRLVEDDVEVVAQQQTIRGADGVERTITVRLPLMRLIFEEVTVSVPVVLDGYEHIGADGTVEYLTADEYRQRTGEEPGPDVISVKIVRSEETTDERVVGVFEEGKRLESGQRAESWDDARQRVRDEGHTIERERIMRFVNRFRFDHVAGEGNRIDGDGPRPDEFEVNPERDNEADFEQLYQTWSRWTVPPPIVYRDGNEWRTITRLATQIGPARRWDGMDAPRFLTRHVSEKWGVAIFQGVRPDWDWANVYVRGLRGHVAKAGLKRDTNETSLPSAAEAGPGRPQVPRSFFKPRMVSQEWVYRVRYERLGDEFEPLSDLIRRQRSFWYLDTSPEFREQELPN
jgi:hypothetical protein